MAKKPVTETYFSQRLRVAMAASGLPGVVIAEATGKSGTAVHKWMTGVTRPSQNDLAIICDLTGCSCVWLSTPLPVNLTVVETPAPDAVMLEALHHIAGRAAGAIARISGETA